MSEIERRALMKGAALSALAFAPIDLARDGEIIS